MSAPYNFGLSQEDETTEAAALELGPTDRVVCICSAGEMPLSLLALGAAEVVAVDVEPSQLYLAAFKLQALRVLPREQALQLLGYLPASRRQRSRWWAEVAPQLDAEARRFWEDHPQALLAGAIWAGRYERYIRVLVRLVRLALGRRLDKLFSASTLEEQAAIFDRDIGRPWLRSVFRTAFHPRLYRSRGMDPRSLQHRDAEQSLGDQFFGQFRALCTATLATDNPLLQLTLLGRLVSADAAPAGLSARGVELLRTRFEALRFEQADLRGYLASQPAGRFNKVQVSNLPDWLSQSEFDALVHTLAARIARPGRAVWRYLHVKRTIPETLPCRATVQAELGAELGARDRFPFYGIVPVIFEDPTEA